MHLKKREVVRIDSMVLCGRLRLTNLITIFEELSKKDDEGNAIDVVYMNVKKAFDKALHAGCTGWIDSGRAS